jgi:histone H3
MGVSRFKQVSRQTAGLLPAREAIHEKASEGRQWASKTVPGGFAKMAAMSALELKNAKLSGAMRAQDVQKARLSGEAGGQKITDKKKTLQQKRYELYRKASKEMKQLQAREELIMPKSTFEKMVRSIAQEQESTVRMQPASLEALQEMYEGYMTGVFSDVALAAMHRKAKTAMPKDLKLVETIRGQCGQSWCKDSLTTVVKSWD